MKEKIKIAYVGIGRRGSIMLRECFAQMGDVEIPVICDISEAKLEKGRQILADKGRAAPLCFTDYDKMLADCAEKVDAVVIMTGWDSRPEMAKKAMLAGKYTAIEVGCAQTLEECFELIDVYEQTGSPLMMMENCCYGRREMMVLNMVKQGLFGEIVHCTGAYAHYLNRCELFAEMFKDGKPVPDGEVTHYRLQHYIDGNRENYPTHELGPICKVLNVNRGNRLLRLSSFASKSAGLKAYAKEHFGEDSKYAKLDYKQGDVVNTIITCAGGETISINLDTTAPRAYYSRNFSVRGTKGMSTEEHGVIFLEGMREEIGNNEGEMAKQYDHPLHVEYEALGTRGGHGGMDWLVCRAFIEAVKNEVNTPIDAYDSVTWLAIGALSEQSIKMGGAPVEIPDFTRGKWQNREPVVRGKYCLDEIIEDRSVKIFDDIDY
ncbi:MAG: Gfo/Idh/MocA family oxidoreductase [Clostridia bacterium]|nr:Gfo/Idh/MocA family oxidoreductase [Clostridia bacterium]